MSATFRDKTRGRWRSILVHFGIDPNILNGKHTSCPRCGGKDRWRFDDKGGNGSWICSHCGSGSGTDLIMMSKGWDFKQTAQEVEAVLGIMKETPRKPERSSTQKRASLQKMWESSLPIKRGDPVSMWLKNRVGNILFPSCLRYAESIIYAGDTPAYFPAMLARVDGLDGSPQTIHRTYLTPDGHKANVEEARRLMPGTVEPGSAVRLFAPIGGILAVAEGIETALAVTKITALPCWATINTANMQAFVPPDDVEELYIFADNDEKFAGQAAAYALAKKLASKTPSKIKVEVILPENVGMDWNDVLKARYARTRENNPPAMA